MESFIKVENVSKRYGSGAAETCALDDISMSIDAGEFLAIVGTSGSGKTTLLNVIGGLDRKFTGRVVVDGHNIETMKDRALSQFRNRTIGFIFQHFNLLSHMTCLENVLMPAFFSSITRGAENHAKGLLSRLGLKDKIYEKPSNLSGGQRQRVAIARSLLNRPKIILCDEPTGNLDSKTGKQIIELFSELNQDEGITFLVITHEEAISQVAKRVIHLEDGRLVD